MHEREIKKGIILIPLFFPCIVVVAVKRRFDFVIVLLFSYESQFVLDLQAVLPPRTGICFYGMLIFRQGNYFLQCSISISQL